MARDNPDNLCSIKCADLLKRYIEFSRKKIEEGNKKVAESIRLQQQFHINSKAYSEIVISRRKFPNYIVIGDTHLPYEDPYYLSFIMDLCQKFSVPKDRVYHVGDIFDLYWFSNHPKSPNATHSPIGELEDAMRRVALWVDAFPLMHLILANHEARLFKRAQEIGLPDILLKEFKDMFELPASWTIQDRFLVFGELNSFMIEHGEGFKDARDMAIHLGVNALMGHLHGKAGTGYLKTSNQELWFSDTGCGVNSFEYAFAYGSKSKLKPMLGASIVHNGGEYVTWHPL